MKKLFLFVFITAIVVIAQGCIVFHKISYNINLDKNHQGKASIIVYDLRSDAKTPTDLDNDINTLFQYALKSDEFLEEAKKDGITVQDRDLFMNSDTLNAKFNVAFTNVKSIESIQHEAGFYYLHLELNDSIVETNGTVVPSKNYKRILWRDDIKNLTFTILGNSFEENKFTMLGAYYNKSK